MIYEFDSIASYHTACEADPGLRGVSPGGASGLLGMSRQGVYNAVKRGTLDEVRVTERGTGPYLFIPDKSIKNYMADHRGRNGPRPGFRQRVQLSVDKYVHGVWPNP